MRAPTRAREISFTFTFTPRRVYRPLRSGDGGADSEVPRRLCTRLVFALRSFLRAVAVKAWRKRSPLPPNRCLLPLPQITRPRSPPIAFSARGAPPCRKGDNVEQKLRFRRGTAGGQWGKGAFCAHRDDEGQKWRAVVQVCFH